MVAGLHAGRSGNQSHGQKQGFDCQIRFLLLLLWKSQEDDFFCYVFLLVVVELRLQGQRTTICPYFYSLAIKIVFCLRFGQKSDTIIDDNF